jgi:hypothetical protein
VAPRRLEHRLLQIVELALELFDLRTVVVHHRVHDPVHQGHGALREDVVVARAHPAHLGDGARLAVVDRDEVVRAEEEVGVVRGEVVLARLEVDAVQDDVEIAVVRLDLRMVHLGDRILDRERVEVKRVAEDPEVLVGRRRQVHPDSDSARRLEPRGIHPIRLLGGAVAVDEDGDHVMQPAARGQRPGPKGGGKVRATASHSRSALPLRP